MMRLQASRRGILFPVISDGYREKCSHQLGSTPVLLSAEIVRVSTGAQLGTLHVTSSLDIRHHRRLDRRGLDGLGTADAARRSASGPRASAWFDGTSAPGRALIRTGPGMGTCTGQTTPARRAGLCGRLSRRPGASRRRSGLSEGTPRPLAATARDLAGNRCDLQRKRHGRASSLREAAPRTRRFLHLAAAGHGRRTGRPSTGPSTQDQRRFAEADSHTLGRAAEADRPVDAAFSVLTGFRAGGGSQPNNFTSFAGQAIV